MIPGITFFLTQNFGVNVLLTNCTKPGQNIYSITDVSAQHGIHDGLYVGR